MDEFSEPKTRKEIKDALGISEENIDFYTQMGMIVKSGKIKLRYKLKMHNYILERGTVFKYCFEDGFMDELREFVTIVKHKSDVRVIKVSELTQEERKRYENNINNAKEPIDIEEKDTTIEE